MMKLTFDEIDIKSIRRVWEIKTSKEYRRTIFFF